MNPKNNSQLTKKFFQIFLCWHLVISCSEFSSELQRWSDGAINQFTVLVQTHWTIFSVRSETHLKFCGADAKIIETRCFTFVFIKENINLKNWCYCESNWNLIRIYCSLDSQIDFFEAKFKKSGVFFNRLDSENSFVFFIMHKLSGNVFWFLLLCYSSSRKYIGWVSAINASEILFRNLFFWLL